MSRITNEMVRRVKSAAFDDGSLGNRLENTRDALEALADELAVRAKLSKEELAIIELYRWALTQPHLRELVDIIHREVRR